MYSFGIYLYAFIVRLLACFGHRKAGLMVRGQHETWRILRHQIREGERYVWFHAASLGEFEQGRPLMERLRSEQPDCKILLTFFSPSGYEVRKNYDVADVVCYLPFDTPTAVRRFIKSAQPEMLVLIKYEFWRNYIDVLHRRHIPIYSVSSIFRPNQVFFRWYGRNYARCLRRITHFFVQNEVSRQLLSGIGVKENVTIVGDTRFDRVIDIHNAARPLPVVEAFAADHCVLVAGSTWAPDEDILIDYFNHHPELRLVIAPHVVSEQHLAEIEQKMERPVVRYSHTTPEEAARYDCLIIDNYGLLSSIYRYARVAYIGGGFGVSIHNVPEAAVYGVPVVFGPNNKKFREAQDLLSLGGAFEIHTADDFNALLDDFSAHPDRVDAAGRAAGTYIHDNAGAGDIIFRHIWG